MTTLEDTPEDWIKSKECPECGIGNIKHNPKTMSWECDSCDWAPQAREKRMNIRVGDFRIKADSTQFTLYKIKTKGGKALTPGAEFDAFAGYYPTFEGCMRAIPTKALLESDVESLADAIKIIVAYRDMVSGALKGV